FVMVPVRGLDAIGRARPDAARFDAACGAVGHRSVFLFCRDSAERDHFLHARMFAPRAGISEDPATGSAVAAFAGLLARYGGLGDGEHTVTVEQGFEMGRPSLMRLSVTLKAGALVAAAIGGDAVVISEGTIEA